MAQSINTFLVLLFLSFCIDCELTDESKNDRDKYLTFKGSNANNRWLPSAQSESDDTTPDEDSLTNDAITSSVRSLSKRSADKANAYYGFFGRDGKFHNCSRPTKNSVATKQTNTTLLKCQYFDQMKLKNKLDRHIESDNGFKGVFGYFDTKKFHYCEPPAQFYDSPNKTKTKYIPFYLNYDWNCQYFEHDPGTLYDFVKSDRTTTSRKRNSSMDIQLSISKIGIVLIVLLINFII